MTCYRCGGSLGIGYVEGFGDLMLCELCEDEQDREDDDDPDLNDEREVTVEMFNRLKNNK